LRSTGAGKPNFYTDEARPFRELCQETRRLQFKQVVRLEPGHVYTEGCLKELMRLMDWNPKRPGDDQFTMRSGSHEVAPNALYIGDSLFADLVDAKREFGWTTAAVTPEVGFETEIQTKTDYILAQKAINLLLDALRSAQDEFGNSLRSPDDLVIMDKLEKLVSQWRDRETQLLGNNFGSVFRARYQPSLFAHSLKRYCDLYMPSVSCLRNYSPQHRFYPQQNLRLLAHEIDLLDLVKDYSETDDADQ
jgi:5' nucleotidase family